MCPHQLGVSSVVQDDVLRFEVSVDDSSGVQESQSLYDAARVEASGAVIKRSPAAEAKDDADTSRSIRV